MTLIQPDADMQILIRKELNEDVNTRDADLQHMKEWLLKQPHLPDTWGEFIESTFYFKRKSIITNIKYLHKEYEYLRYHLR